MSEMLGNQYFLSGQYEKALAQYREVLSQNPRNKAVLIHTILAETRVGQLEEALVHLIQLLSLEPRSIAPGNAYLEPVCHDVQKGFSEKNENSLAQAILALLCGKCEEARRLFQRFGGDVRWRESIQTLLQSMEKLGEDTKI